MGNGRYSYRVSQDKDGSWRTTISTPAGKHISFNGYASAKGAETAAKKAIGNMTLYSGGWRPWEQKDEKKMGGGSTPRCPDCGARMVKREGEFGQFWGCSRYPGCKGTRSL